ncbi:hypothetical protein IWX80_002564 [Flavobacterium sp. CAN_S2]
MHFKSIVSSLPKLLITIVVHNVFGILTISQIILNF